MIKLGRSKEYYAARDALQQYKRLLPHLPESQTRSFAHEVLSFLERFERSFSSVNEMEEWISSLYELPRRAISDNVTILRQTAVSRCKKDPWLALQLTGLLIYQEFYADAAELGQDIVKQHPKTKRYESVMRNASLVSAIAQSEACLVDGRIEAALELVDEAISLAREISKDESEVFDLDVFTVAERVANRIREL